MKYLFFVLLLLPFSSCSTDSNAQKNKPATETSSDAATDGVIEVAEFAEKIKQSPEAQLIDVRTAEEFAAGHLPGARNWDYLDGTLTEQIKTLDQSKPVFVYCKSGGRSGKSYQQLKKAGFVSVYDLKGGYTKWNSSKMDIEY